MSVCVHCDGRGDHPVDPNGELGREGWSDLECSACHGTGQAPDVRTACAVTLDQVAVVVGSVRCDLTREDAIQQALDVALRGAFGDEAVSREHRLGPADRPDFLICGAIVVEAKGKRHRAPQVERQLARYARYPEVTGIVLATARSMGVPRMVGAKIVRNVSLSRAWL